MTPPPTLAMRCPRAPDPEFLIRSFEPAYLALHRSGELQKRVAAGLKELEDCCACPRNCHVNRLEDQARVCGTGRCAIVSSAFPHFGEENCLRGWNGSGTIFFSHCNLRCVFCQNWDISQRRNGRKYTAEEIADLMFLLQRRGCHNINFVTPEHVVPQVIEAVAAAVPRGLNLALVYNTSAYDSVESLRLLDGIVDIYMPDFKFWERESARQYVKAKDYPERARAAILEMHRQVGPLKFNEDGLARRGLLVRHLVMPGQTAEATAIFKWLAEEVSPDTYINIMDQYRPEYSVAEEGNSGKYAAIARRSTVQELRITEDAAKKAGLFRIDTR